MNQEIGDEIKMIKTTFSETPSIVIHEHYSEDSENIKTIEGFTRWSLIKEHFQKYFPVDLNNFKAKRVKDTQDMYYPLIKNLNVNFIPSTSSNMFTYSRHWSLWFQNPYFHIYIIETKNYNDILKKKITDWMKDMKEKHYHFIILCLPSPGSIKKLSLLTQKPYIIDKVFDSIKKDFGNDERIIRLGQNETLQGLQSSDINDIIYRITDEVLHEFVKRKKRIEREIRKFEDNKTLPGWNYYHYFMLKETLAINFQIIGLYRVAINIYKDVLKFKKNERIESSKFINQECMNNIFDIHEKNFRSLLYNSSITEFEFQNYCFSRIVTLMFKQKTPEESAELSLEFIPNMCNQLKKEIKENSFFIYSWAYCTTMNIVDECRKNAFETLFLEKYFRTLGDLYSYAKYTLKMSKLTYQDIKNLKLTNSEESLIKIITNEKEYDKLFLEISSAASGGYSSGKRTRFLNRTNSEISSIRLKEEKYDEVIGLLKNQVQFYIKEDWDILIIDALKKLSIAQFNEGLLNDYIFSCIQLLIKNYKIEKEKLKKSIQSLNEKLELNISNQLFNLEFPIHQYDLKYSDFLNLSLNFNSKFLNDLPLDFILIFNNDLSIEKSNLYLDKNRILLDKKFNEIGSFQLKKIIYKYQILELIENRNDLIINVQEIHPIIDISILSDILLLNRNYVIPVRFSVKGILFGYKISITSKSGLELSDNEYEFNNFIENKPFTVKMNVKSEGMKNVKHQLNVSLTILTKTKGNFKIEKTFYLDFYMPFTYLTNLKFTNDKTIIQFILNSNLPFNMSILQSKMNENQEKDTNQKVILPKESISYFYVLNSNLKSCSLHLTCKIGLQNYNFKINHQWENPNILFNIKSLINQENIIQGKIYHLDYEIYSLNEKDIIYEIESNDQWMIQGHLKKKLLLQSNETKKISLLLSPLVCGYLSLPKMNLISIDSQQIHYDTNRILVLSDSSSPSIVGLSRIENLLKKE